MLWFNEFYFKQTFSRFTSCPFPYLHTCIQNLSNCCNHRKARPISRIFGVILRFGPTALRSRGPTPNWTALGAGVHRVLCRLPVLGDRTCSVVHFDPFSAVSHNDLKKNKYLKSIRFCRINKKYLLHILTSIVSKNCFNLKKNINKVDTFWENWFGN